MIMTYNVSPRKDWVSTDMKRESGAGLTQLNSNCRTTRCRSVHGGACAIPWRYTEPIAKPDEIAWLHSTYVVFPPTATGKILGRALRFTLHRRKNSIETTVHLMKYYSDRI